MAGWDRSAMMPPKGSEARAGAMAEMDALMHRIRTDAQLAQWLQRAEDEDLGEIERANLREMCVRVPIEVHEGIHVGALNDERILKCQQFVLGAQSSMPVEQPSAGQAQATVARFPVGATVTVYYNPSNPSESALER